MHWIRTATVGLALLGLLSGCGPSSSKPKTIPVTGTVTLDGQAVSGASVVFGPTKEGVGNAANGMTDSSGKFAMSTFASQDGAVAGQYTVTVTLSKAGGGDADAMKAAVMASKPGAAPAATSNPYEAAKKNVEYVIPKKYSDPKTSGLTAEVKEGMAPLTLELSSK